MSIRSPRDRLAQWPQTVDTAAATMDASFARFDRVRPQPAPSPSRRASRMRATRGIAVTFLLACLLAGCATLPPPTAEVDAAQAAVAAATAADADQYAAHDLGLARD